MRYVLLALLMVGCGPTAEERKEETKQALRELVEEKGKEADVRLAKEKAKLAKEKAKLERIAKLRADRDAAIQAILAAQTKEAREKAEEALELANKALEDKR